jgi:hypothetical protein
MLLVCVYAFIVNKFMWVYPYFVVERLFYYIISYYVSVTLLFWFNRIILPLTSSKPEKQETMYLDKKEKFILT